MSHELVLALNRVAPAVPAASCGSVSLPARTPGGTPGELAGGDACATSQDCPGSWCAILKSWRLPAVSAPMTAHPHVAVTARDITRPHPHGVWTRADHPSPANPYPLPLPFPTARHPHVSGPRRHHNDFPLGWWWRSGDDDFVWLGRDNGRGWGVNHAPFHEAPAAKQQTCGQRRGDYANCFHKHHRFGRCRRIKCSAAWEKKTRCGGIEAQSARTSFRAVRIVPDIGPIP